MIENLDRSFDFCGSAIEHNTREARILLFQIVEEIFANDCLEIKLESSRADGWSDARNYDIRIRISNPCA
jgi:hypothetical protein